jgi:galactokinase
MLANTLPLASLYTVAPGRVNLLGEHVDYNGGPVLPVAIDRAVNLAADPTPASEVHLHAIDLNEQVAFRLSDLDARVDRDGVPLPAWALYPAGIAWALREAGFTLGGLRGSFTSSIPIGAGLSSSAAVEMAFAVAWQAFGGWQASPMTLAMAGKKAENEYCGVQSGLMDQFACAHGIAGHALYLDTAALTWRPVPLPRSTSLVIADSGVRRNLASSAYNDRRASCEEALQILKQHLPGITHLADVSPQDFDSLANLLPEVTARRARHIVEECERVRQAVRLLEVGDGDGFGRLMLAGHASLRDLYEVSILELDALVEIASALEGCLGARLTGAGFGGCTINLVDAHAVPAFIEGLREGYRQHTGKEAQVFQCRASRGAHVERVF